MDGNGNGNGWMGGWMLSCVLFLGEDNDFVEVGDVVGWMDGWMGWGWDVLRCGY